MRKKQEGSRLIKRQRERERERERENHSECICFSRYDIVKMVSSNGSVPQNDDDNDDDREENGRKKISKKHGMEWN